ncbi:unnamed protein product [Camellia sinensis]
MPESYTVEMTVSRILLSEVHSHTRFPHCRITDQSHSNLRVTKNTAITSSLRTMMMGTLPPQSIPILDLVKLSEQKN